MVGPILLKITVNGISVASMMAKNGRRRHKKPLLAEANI